MKVAFLLPGYIESPDYFHLKFFDKRITELGYTVERLDLGDLWKTGDASKYTITNFIDQISKRVTFYKQQNPEEIILIGHSRGALTAIIAGSRIEGVSKIVALCSPVDVKSSAHKWKNKAPRVSEKDLPDNPKKYRQFSIPWNYVKDSLKYSVINEVKNLKKPLMIFISLDDQVVLPEVAEKIVSSAINPYVVRQPNIGHDFRHSQAECGIVMKEIEKFLIK